MGKLAALALCAGLLAAQYQPPGGGGGATPGGATGAVQYNNAGALGGNGTLVSAVLADPAAPAVVPTCAGTCATGYDYSVISVTNVGVTFAGPITTVNNAASLDVTHFNTVTPPACPAFQTRFLVIRSFSLIGTVNCGVAMVDNGLPTQGAAAAPGNTGNYVPTNGLATPGALRSKAMSGLSVGPDYLIDQLVLTSGMNFAGSGDAGQNLIVDSGSCPVSAFAGCPGAYWTLYAYNAATAVKTQMMADFFFDTALFNDGTARVGDFGVCDVVGGFKCLFYNDNQGNQDQTGNMEGTQYAHLLSADLAVATRPVAVGSLPACVASTGIPWRASVSDATTPALGVVVTGGGAVFANVHCSLTTGTYLVDGL